jgi:hypothetical protein
MESRSDAFLHDVIAKGGRAMGLSSFMPAWQGIFSEPEIEDLVAYIRTLALPRKSSTIEPFLNTQEPVHYPTAIGRIRSRHVLSGFTALIALAKL